MFSSEVLGNLEDAVGIECGDLAACTGVHVPVHYFVERGDPCQETKCSFGSRGSPN